MVTKIAYDQITAIKVSVIGNVSVGKTSICTRIVNNFFSALYEPTIETQYYTTLIKITDAEVINKVYLFATLEDFFGLNNPILQASKETVNSEYIKKKQEKMTKEFRALMFSSVTKRDQLSKEAENIKTKKFDPKKDKDPKFLHYENIFVLDNSIERKGYIIVVDITDPTTLQDAATILEKLVQIEKTSNLTYPKCIFVNKIDRTVDKKKIKAFYIEADQLKQKYKTDIFKVSALNNTGVLDAFKKFLGKIHQILLDQKQNEGLEENDDLSEEEDPITCNDKWNACTRKCLGTNVFACGNPDDTDENEESEDEI